LATAVASASFRILGIVPVDNAVGVFNALRKVEPVTE
jgi:hypothetical protein